MFAASGGYVGGGTGVRGGVTVCVCVCEGVVRKSVCVHVPVARNSRLCINRNMSMVGKVTVMSWVFFQYVLYLSVWVLVCVCPVWISGVALTLLFSHVSVHPGFKPQP